MSDIAPVYSTPSLSPIAGDDTRRHAGAPARDAQASRSPDRVEVSELSMYLSRLKDLPAVREDLVASVRKQIAEGTYETPEKLDAAIDQLAREL